MKVFDFDNTLYDGECSLDFFMYCLKKKKSLLKYMPAVTAKALKYKAGLVSIDEVYEFVDEMLVVFFDNLENLEEHVKCFWELNSKKLKKSFLEKISEDDAIISASPRFLFDGIASRLRTSNILCTEIDMENQKIEYLCYSQNKVKAFKEHFESVEIEEFYTDNMNDMPLIELAKTAYLVKGNNISKIK